MGEHFEGLELLEVVVVALDQDLVIGAVEVVSLIFDCLDNRQEVKIVSLVVLFWRRAFSIVEITRGKNPESVVLVKDAGDCDAAYLGQQNDRFLPVEMLEDRCYGKGLCEVPNCKFSILSPFRLP